MTTITINNWEKFNPRKDRANYSWLRLDNNIIFSEDLEGLTAEQKWFWVCLLAYASRKQKTTFEYNVLYFTKHFSLNESKMSSALEHLQKMGTITLSHGDAETPKDTDGVGTPRYERTNETDVTNVTNERDETFGVQNLFDLWNSKRKTLPEAKQLSPSRIKSAKSQLEKYPDLEHWEEAMNKFSSSDFCLNEWRPGFDDFLNETKRIRAIEGTYDNKAKVSDFQKKLKERFGDNDNDPKGAA